MGLGKTPQACVALQDKLEVFTGNRALVICPANLRVNWLRELAIWSPTLSAATPEDAFPSHDVIVVSYNGLAKWYDALRRAPWQIVIADEAHYMKTLDSQRTTFLRGGFGHSPIQCLTKWALTGTPMLNRPIELYPILKWLDTPWAPKEVVFGNRYCGGQSQEFRGATNIPELREKLKTIMLRRLKADVLEELPPKTREVIELELDEDGKAAVAEEKNALRAVGLSFEDVINNFESPRLNMEQKGVIAKLRQRTGMIKVKAAAEFILEILESVQKVIVFAHHVDVIAGVSRTVSDAGFLAVRITGNTPPPHRQHAIDVFQNDPNCRVFLGNIQAAGVGITLTAASHVIFVESDWTPGGNAQAEDRAHRFGQTRGVLVQHLVLTKDRPLRFPNRLRATAPWIHWRSSNRPQLRHGATTTRPTYRTCSRSTREQLRERHY